MSINLSKLPRGQRARKLSNEGLVGLWILLSPFFVSDDPGDVPNDPKKIARHAVFFGTPKDQRFTLKETGVNIRNVFNVKSTLSCLRNC